MSKSKQEQLSQKLVELKSDIRDNLYKEDEVKISNLFKDADLLLNQLLLNEEITLKERINTLIKIKTLDIRIKLKSEPIENIIELVSSLNSDLQEYSDLLNRNEIKKDLLIVIDTLKSQNTGNNKGFTNIYETFEAFIS